MLKHIFGILLGVVFGSSQLMAAATCNDSAVVDEFLEKYICSNILVCSVFGIKNYKELKSLSNEEITSRYNNSAVAKQLNELKKNISTAWHFTNYKDKLNVNALLSTRTLIKSINTNPIDYNAAIKKYACEAKLTFGENELVHIAHYVGFNGLISATEQSKMITASLSANEGDKALQIISALMPRMVVKIKECYASTMPFTVQPVDPGSALHSAFAVSFDGTNSLNHGTGACP